MVRRKEARQSRGQDKKGLEQTFKKKRKGKYRNNTERKRKM